MKCCQLEENRSSSSSTWNGEKRTIETVDAPEKKMKH